jgi:acetylornithine deacetylase/succinyl-diaminopimelate desuccinylase-like protein
VTGEEIGRLHALLRIPSVSALPAHVPDMAAAAELVAEEIRRAGGHAAVRAGDRHPLVVGEVPASSGDPSAPRVLLYGHYDVQPPGPEELWTSPPFTPTVRDGNLYARGASDDKGNLFMLLVAVQRLAGAGALPVRAAFLVDGEEESGGSSALDHVAADTAPATAAIIFDGPMIGPGRPSFCTGLRGMVYRRLRLRTAVADAHSGLFGGAALNAVHALTTVLATVMPVDGRLPEPLYAGLAPAGPAEVAAWDELPAGGQSLAEAGLRPADRGAADGFHMRTLASPSLDVHGVAAGDPGAVKTIVPGEAVATLSLRLAPGQDPDALGAALDGLLAAAAPPGAELEIEDLGAVRPALIDPDQPALVAAATAMERAVGRRPAPVRMGGSIPIVAALVERGIPTVLSGFALPDDAFHAPDEHIRVEHLELGTRAAMEMLTALGALPPAGAGGSAGGQGLG